MNYVSLPLKRNEKYTYLIISTNHPPLFKRLCTSGACLLLDNEKTKKVVRAYEKNTIRYCFMYGEL